MNSGPLSTRIRFGRPIRLGNSLQCRYHVRTSIACPHVDRRRDTGEVVDDGQHADLPAVEQLIRQEIHRPAVVGSRGDDTILATLRRHLSLRRFPAQLQALLAIQTARALVVDRPTLAPQQDVDASIAVSDTGFRQLADTLAEARLLGTAVLIVEGGAVEADHATGPPDADPVAGP